MGCVEVAEQGLKLEPGHEELKRLREESRRALEKIREVSKLLEQARQKLGQREFDAVVKVAEEALKLDAGNREAVELRQTAAEAQERVRRIAELLRVARGHEKAQDYESCCRICAEGLKLEPSYGEFEKLLEQAQQALRKKQQVENLLQKARQQAGKQEFEEVLKTVSELLKLEPGHRTALELQTAAAEGMDRSQKIAQRLEEALGYERAGDYQSCSRVSAQGLELEPAHTELRAVQQRAQAALDRIKRVKELAKEARQGLEQEAFSRALKAIEEIESLEPENQEAVALKQLVMKTQECREKITQLRVTAQNRYDAQDFESVHQLATQGLELDPEDAGLKDLQQRAAQMLARDREVHDLLGEAQRHFDAQEYQAALGALEQVLGLVPGHSQGLEWRRRVSEVLKRRQKVEQLLAAARERHGVEDHAECYRVTTQALELEPEHAELKRLQEQSGQALERQRKLEKLLEAARQAREGQDFGKVDEILEELLSIDPGNAEAFRLKESAIAALNRKRQLEALLNEARQRFKTEDYEACGLICEEALGLEPGHAELTALRESAGRVFEKRKHVEQLLEKSRQQVEGQEFEQALETVGQVLVLEPQHPKAIEIQQTAEAGREREKRLSGIAVTLAELDACAGQALARISENQDLLSRGYDLLGKKENSAALRVAEESLAAFPGNLRAIDLKRTTEVAMERDAKVQQLLVAARHAQANRDFLAGLKGSKRALALDPNHPGLLTILQQSREGLKKTGRVSSLLAEAKERLAAGDHETAFALTTELLDLQGDHAEALQIKNSTASKVAREICRELLGNAREFYLKGDYESCLRLVTEGLELEVHDSALLDLRDQTLRISKDRDQVSALLSSAYKHLQNQECEHAAKMAKQALSLGAPSEVVFEVEDLADKLSSLAALRQKIRHVQSFRLTATREDLLAIGFEACVLCSGDAHANRCCSTYGTLLRELYDDHTAYDKLDELATLAQQDIEIRRFQAALGKLSFLLALQPSHTQGLKLKQLAHAGVEDPKALARPQEVKEEKRRGRLDASSLMAFWLFAKNRRWLGISATATLVAVIVAGVLLQKDKGSVQNQPVGFLELNVSPWARIDSVNRVEDRAQADFGMARETPCRLELPSGKYLVKLSNPQYQSSEIEVEIKPGQTTVTHVTLAGFQSDKEIQELLDPSK